jgi:hypothetical protein
MITIFHAIQSLVPGAEISISLFDQSIEWHRPSTAPVTLEQIQAEQQRLQKAYDWSQYQRNRAREYPSIQDQLDALYHAGVFPPAMAAKIQAVKQKYPRPPIDQQQWQDQMPVESTHVSTTAPDFHPAHYPEARMTVEQWLAYEAKITREEWLAQQNQPRHLTREEWLAEQTNLRN